MYFSILSSSTILSIEEKCVRSTRIFFLQDKNIQVLSSVLVLSHVKFLHKYPKLICHQSSNQQNRQSCVSLSSDLLFFFIESQKDFLFFQSIEVGRSFGRIG